LSLTPPLKDAFTLVGNQEAKVRTVGLHPKKKGVPERRTGAPFSLKGRAPSAKKARRKPWLCR